MNIDDLPIELYVELYGCHHFCLINKPLHDLDNSSKSCVCNLLYKDGIEIYRNISVYSHDFSLIFSIMICYYDKNMFNELFSQCKYWNNLHILESRETWSIFKSSYKYYICQMVKYNNIKLLLFHLERCQMDYCYNYMQLFTIKIIDHSINTFNKYMMKFCFSCTYEIPLTYSFPCRYFCTNINYVKCKCDKSISCFNNNTYLYCFANYSIRHLNWLYKHFNFPKNNKCFYSLTKSIYCKFNKNNCKLKWLYDNKCYLPTYIKAKMYYKKLIN